MDDGYDLLAVRIKRGTDTNGAVVALCPPDGYDRPEARIARAAAMAAFDQALAAINRILHATFDVQADVVTADVCIDGPPVP